MPLVVHDDIHRQGEDRAKILSTELQHRTSQKMGGNKATPEFVAWLSSAMLLLSSSQIPVRVRQPVHEPGIELLKYILYSGANANNYANTNCVLMSAE